MTCPDLYYSRELTAALTRDAAGDEVVFKRDAVSRTLEFDEATTYQITLTDVDGSYPIYLGGVEEARLVYLECDGPLSVTLDAATLYLAPEDDGLAVLLIEKAEVTSVMLEVNAVDTTVKVFLAMAGGDVPPP